MLVDDVWRVGDEAIDELGANAVARLRAEMRRYLDTGWAEVEKRRL
ncbi:MAG: hypothetical protein ACOYXM_17875 [Actinomycetota bacterium]